MEKEKEKERKEGFLSYVFNFDEDTKSNLLNTLQFSFLSIIPIVILNKSIQRFVPEADDEKSSLEITAEVLIQIMVMFVGIFYINRIIQFIPTFSQCNYPDFNVILFIIPVLFITLGLQTKLGEKITILVDRLYDLWEGKKKKGKKEKQQQQPQQSPSLENTPSGTNMMGVTSIHNLPISKSNENFVADNEPTIMAANEFMGGFGSGF